MVKLLPARFALLLGALGLAAFSALRAATIPPEEAVRRMVVPADLEVKLVACEPEIRQPISIRFDARGRMWILQYLQYPHPAGLKPVSVDLWLRTVYDQIPAPPPFGPKGADRITICDQPDAQGRMHRFKDFVSDLNLCSGFALGYDGVFVIQPPYLLFYPDRNHDDVPDGPPQVLLSGFGLQDAHALANNLQFGPDGWLYGAQGSTVTSTVNGIEFNQGIWRYHPVTKKFELFAEGGGNTWGLDFDAHGNAIAGTNFGGKVALHQVQGAYYVKVFAKHGELHNPYAFGYFDHIPMIKSKFVGGHVTPGGLVYQGGTLPDRFNGAYIAANLLSNKIFWHTFTRDGSSFRLETKGEFLVANDPCFRPVDCYSGPDGAVYVADWYDRRATHVDPRDDWDKATGRIYRVQTKGAAQIGPLALDRAASRELVQMLDNPNEWYVRTARQLLAERQDPETYSILQRNILSHAGKLALESLWALYASGGFDEAFGFKTLEHPNEDVRTWTVRFLGDSGGVGPAMAESLQRLAETDPSPTVRNQLACSAKRLPGPAALPIIRALLHRDEDASDPQIPLLLWWAIENKAVSDREGVLSLLSAPADWKAPIMRKYIVERLARRYASEENPLNFATDARLLDAAPGPREVDLLVAGMEKAFDGRVLPSVPPEFVRALDRLWAQGDPSPLFIRFAARLGSPEGIGRAQALVSDPAAPIGQRLATIPLLGQTADPRSEQALEGLLGNHESAFVQSAALKALQSFSDPTLSERVLALYPHLSVALRLNARALLEARASSALLLLQAVDRKEIAQTEIPNSEVRKIAALAGPEITALIFKHWGEVTAAATGQKQALSHTIQEDLHRHKGDWAAGRKIFLATCSACHTLFGEGGHIGPDLTSVDRMNTPFMVDNILSPSLTIRPEFIAYNVELQDGRVLTGFIADSNDQTVTVRDAADQRTTVPRNQVKTMNASPISLMPEGLLDAFEPQQLADLFAYLQKQTPPNVSTQ